MGDLVYNIHHLGQGYSNAIYTIHYINVSIVREQYRNIRSPALSNEMIVFNSILISILPCLCVYNFQELTVFIWITTKCIRSSIIEFIEIFHKLA